VLDELPRMLDADAPSVPDVLPCMLDADAPSVLDELPGMLDAAAADVLPSLPMLPSAASSVLGVLPIGYGVESDVVGAGVLDADAAGVLPSLVLPPLVSDAAVLPMLISAVVISAPAPAVLDVLSVGYGVDVVGAGVLDVDSAGVLEVLLVGYGVELVVGYGVVVVVRQTPPSHLQKGEHPSPEAVLPSSHCSSTKPGLRELLDGHTGKITVDDL
jgi:hypothetical protein